MRNMQAMKIAKEGFFNRASASRPRISPRLTSAPAFMGGVWGRLSEKIPNSSEAPPAR